MKTIEALFGKTVAFPKGFFYEEVLTKSFPQIKRLPVEDTLASLKAVTFGRRMPPWVRRLWFEL